MPISFNNSLNFDFKACALHAYGLVTQRSRTKLKAALRESGIQPVAVLFYHRVADRNPNPWTIGCADFARQLDWLQEHFEVISLSEAQQRLRTPGSNVGTGRPNVAITFDDGYAENADFAIPELYRRNLPATYFVATSFVDGQAAFPHDVAAGQPLRPDTQSTLASYLEMGIELGAHTRSHCDLGTIADKLKVRDEIEGSISDLESWFGIKVTKFAFPYGLPENTSQVAVDVLRENQISTFCTAYGALNWPGGESVHIRRIHADPGMQRLKNWLTLDPRKLWDESELPFVDDIPPKPACLDLITKA